MLDINIVGKKLENLGFSLYSGVPCSFFKDLINYLINKDKYIAAVNEADAISIASGGYIGGLKTVVIMQNSGLINALSPLVSLNDTFKIPLLGFISLRGEPGINDEPQHKLMGNITTKLLDLVDIEWQFLSKDSDKVHEQLIKANRFIEINKSFFFIVKKNTFKKLNISIKDSITKNIYGDNTFRSKKYQKTTRLSALKVIINSIDETNILIATTGKTGRELYELGDRPLNFYMVGSMGCVSGLGLGLALAKKEKKVFVIDGDGSLMMRMGVMATIAQNNPKNLIHILLDNNSHDSTGGQSTYSEHIDFVSIAKSVGYENTIYAYNLKSLESNINDCKKQMELTFIYFRIKKGSKKNLGRPKISPQEVKDRLIKIIK